MTNLVGQLTITNLSRETEILVFLICQQVGKICKNLNKFPFFLRFLVLLFIFGRHDQDIVLIALLGQCVRVVRIASIVVLVIVIVGKNPKKCTDRK